MPEQEDMAKPIRRESIWSVKEEDRPKFSIYFTLLFLIGIGFCLWYEIFHVTDDGVLDTIMLLARDVGISGIASVTLSFARFEGGDTMGIALDIFRKRKYEEAVAEGVVQGIAQGIAQGIDQGIAEGIARGIAQGIDQGQAESDAEWEDWFAQFMESQEKGIPFDEPPPSRRRNGVNRDDKPSDE